LSQYGATKVPAEILIAQIYSQCKLARREKRKNRYENEILKANKQTEGLAT
jgi:hypothetical protein